MRAICDQEIQRCPRHGFDGGGNRTAAVGLEFRPRRQRNAVDPGSAEKGAESARIGLCVRADEGGGISRGR